MSKSLRGSVASVLVLVSACVAPEARVKVEKGPAFPAAGLSPTFQWRDASALDSGDPRVADAELQAWIRSELERSLSERGYRVGPTPAFHAVFRLSVQYMGARPGWKEVAYEEGALVLTLIEPGSGRLLWSGSVQLELDPERPREGRRARIARAIAELVDQLDAPGSAGS